MELPANADVEKKDKMSTYVETFLNFSTLQIVLLIKKSQTKCGILCVMVS